MRVVRVVRVRVAKVVRVVRVRVVIRVRWW